MIIQWVNKSIEPIESLLFWFTMVRSKFYNVNINNGIILVRDYWWTLQVLFYWDKHCAKNSYKWRWRQDSWCQLWEMVRDRETWRAAVHGVTRSRAWLGNWTTAAVGEVRLPRAKRCQGTYWDIDWCLILSLGIHYISLFNRAFGQGEWGVRIGLCSPVVTPRR